MKNKINKCDRSRAWCGEFYPESCPDDWMSIVSSWNIPCAVILHDKDVNDDGSPVKPHFQMLYYFPNAVRISSVKSLNSQLGCSNVEMVDSFSAYARYLIHLDSPDKYQYSPDDVFLFSGLDLSEYWSGVSPRKAQLQSIICFILDNHVCELSVLLDHYRDDEELLWLISRNAYIISGLINSHRYEMRDFCTLPLRYDQLMSLSNFLSLSDDERIKLLSESSRATSSRER